MWFPLKAMPLAAIALTLFATTASAMSGQAAPSPEPTSSQLLPSLTDAQLKDPTAALAASRASIGTAWDRFGSIAVIGEVHAGPSTRSYSYVADLRTGYDRMVIQSSDGKDIDEYGVDARGGWNSHDGVVKSFDSLALAIATARYVNRFGFLNPNDKATFTAAGIDPRFGDKVLITPNGGAPFLLVIKKETSLISAIQFGTGQISLFADYRPVQGIYYPFRMLEGKTTGALTVFQATRVTFMPDEPPDATIARPAASKPAVKAQG